MKKILLGLALMMLILSTTVSYASSEQITIAFEEKGKNYEIGWDTKLKELPSELDFIYGLNYVPYWSAPDEETEIKDGYAVGQRSHFSQIKLDRFDVDKITLYYACQFDENGYIEAIDSASLYMARFDMASWTSDFAIDPFIEKCTDKYGEPVFHEVAIEGKTLSGTGWSNIVTYDREYLWSGIDDTALRLVFNYNPKHARCGNCEVFIGKTNLDGSLKEGKLIQAPSFVRALVAENNVPLYDENGSVQVTMNYGTDVVITGYNQQDDLFDAEVEIVETQSTIDGFSAHSSSWHYHYSGKLKGDGLNVNRDELIYYYLVDSTVLPAQRQLDLFNREEGGHNNQSEKHQYVLNINTGVFHYPDCRSVRTMNSNNREFVFLSREELIHSGYLPCQNCNP